VGAGKAEISQHPVAHKLRNKTVVAPNRRRTRLLIGANDLTHVLGIEPRRHRGRTDEIAEHNRELAALGNLRYRTEGGGALSRGHLWGFGLRDGAAAQRLNCGQDPASMADDVDTKVLQVFDRQLRQHRVVDFVFAECRLVSRKA
jgi:hypothetical protein